MKPKNITILGDGGWGTTLAILLSENGHKVTLWSAFAEYAEELNRTRMNRKFLPDISIPSGVTITSDIHRAITSSDILLLTIPSKFLRSVLNHIKPKELNKNTVWVSGVKGIENTTLLCASGIIKELFGEISFAVVSGPCIAYEVSRRLPTAVVVASRDLPCAEAIQEAFMCDRFRVYTSTDVIGVELGGAIKNVIAIASGILDGLGCGINTKAGLLTRGLVEIARLGIAMGADAQTFYGLSGMGDLITTCVSTHGRNRNVGIAIAEGKPLEEIQQMPQVAEGISTTISVKQLSKQYGVEMPITDAVYSVIYEKQNPRVALQNLMMRNKKHEACF